MGAQLSEYTTLQLLDELKRRFKADNPVERKPRPKPEYVCLIGEIMQIRNTRDAFCRWSYVVKFSQEDVDLYGIASSLDPELSRAITRYPGKFRRDNAPKVGDKVIIRDRLTKSKPRFTPATARIYEIVSPETNEK